MSLLEQDTTRKRQVDKALLESEKSWNLRPETTRNIKSKKLSKIQYMANRQMIVTKCQACISSFCGKATQKKKTLKSLHWQSYTFGS